MVRWCEIHNVDLGHQNTCPEACWTVPASMMKQEFDLRDDQQFDHSVPLTSATVDVLRSLYPMSGRNRYVFAGCHSTHRPPKTLLTQVSNCRASATCMADSQHQLGTGYRAKLERSRIVTSAMWLSRDNLTLPTLPVGAPRQVVVGVPARDEATDIIRCLAALDNAAGRAAIPVTIVVGANNCMDTTAAFARSYAARWADVVVDEVLLSPGQAHAGGARRYVMDKAADLAGASGVVMTTDADSRVDVDWIAANLGEIAGGADAVAGVITFDAAARAVLPELRHRAAEWHLASLHARLEHLVDPRPHDPWPRHIWAWGASLALTVEAYRAVGGVPPVALAEDRALADAVERAGLRLRRSHAPLVFTSPRRCGRAPGGFADLLASHADTASPCDSALEPTRILIRRLVLRARMRRENDGGFTEAWSQAEATSPHLARTRLRPIDLTDEVRRAERLIGLLERRAARRADSSHAALVA